MQRLKLVLEKESAPCSAGGCAKHKSSVLAAAMFKRLRVLRSQRLLTNQGTLTVAHMIWMIAGVLMCDDINDGRCCC